MAKGQGGGMVRAVVVAQLVEWSLPTPEFCGSNPDIDKILSTNCTIEKPKIKNERPGTANLFFKKVAWWAASYQGSNTSSGSKIFFSLNKKSYLDWIFKKSV